MSDIFISYARQDQMLAEELAQFLQSLGFPVWWDIELLGSDDFNDVIQAQLSKARAVIVIWSETSVKSTFVRDEARFALQHGKLVATKAPGLDLESIPFGFKGQHTDDIASHDKVVRAIERLGAQRAAAKPAAEKGFEEGVKEKLQAIDTLYQRCKAIGRISYAVTGDPAGTGFLMSGADLCLGWGNESLLLTNAHIVSLNPVDAAPLRPSEAEIEFTRAEGRPRVRLGELVYSSSRTELNISIFRIIAPPDSGVIPLCRVLPEISSTSTQRVYVIGHFKGQELEVSTNDNGVTKYLEQYVHYRNFTEEGVSGSPVLDRQLKCFAIHHRKLRERQMNEGITLDAVIRAIAQQRL
jgi:TIR domain/Trypsin-like peptidase domain